jgi:Cof subfamily protein (haloacid dehalogenase superfamily)
VENQLITPLELASNSEVASLAPEGDGDVVKYKLIAIDLDGTLLSPSSQVTARTKAAIHRALEARLLICFATGRNFTESQTVLDAIEHYDSAVFVGGAMVIDTRQRVTLHRTVMDPELARELCGFFESHGHAALALQDTEAAGVDYLISSELPQHFDTDQWLKRTGASAKLTTGLAGNPHPHTVRVGIVALPDIAKSIHAELQRIFGERIFSHCFGGGEVSVIEVFDPSVNKWQGILHVAQRHHIKPEEIIAIGDEINDITMVKNAGLGVAMGNARPELLKYAKRIIGRNDEDGLAVFLEELLATHAVQPADRN